MRRTIVSVATVTDIMIATAIAAGTVVMIAAVIMAGTVAAMAGTTTVAAGPSGVGTIACGSVADLRIGATKVVPIKRPSCHIPVL